MERLNFFLVGAAALGSALIATPSLAHNVRDTQTGEMIPHAHAGGETIALSDIAVFFAAVVAVSGLAIILRRMRRALTT